MLDIITISSSFFKHVNNCEVFPLRVRSDHSAVRMTFLNRTIKLKTRNDKRLIIDWSSIQKYIELNKKINLILHEKLKGQPSNYTDLNVTVLRRAELSAMILNTKNQGWFHYSRDVLQPAMNKATWRSTKSESFPKFL